MRLKTVCLHRILILYKVILQCSCVCFLLQKSSLFSFQRLNSLQNKGVLDICFDPGSQRSSCCACTLCILRAKTAPTVRNNSNTAVTVSPPSTRKKNIKRIPTSNKNTFISHLLQPGQSDLRVERSLVPVEELFYTLPDLWGDVSNIKRSNILPYTTLR